MIWGKEGRAHEKERKWKGKSNKDKKGKEEGETMDQNSLAAVWYIFSFVFWEDIDKMNTIMHP